MCVKQRHLKIEGIIRCTHAVHGCPRRTLVTEGAACRLLKQEGMVLESMPNAIVSLNSISGHGVVGCTGFLQAV